MNAAVAAPSCSLNHRHAVWSKRLGELRRALGECWSVHSESGQLLDAQHLLGPGEARAPATLARVVAQAGMPQVDDSYDPLLLLGVPLGDDAAAVATLLRGPFDCQAALEAASAYAGCDPAELHALQAKAEFWTPHSLLRMLHALEETDAARNKVRRLEQEVEQVSENLAATYEEISLLYGVTQNLRLSSSETRLGEMALEWLLECLPAEAVAAFYLPVADGRTSTYQARKQPTLISRGSFGLSSEQIVNLVGQLDLGAGCAPLVLNSPHASAFSRCVPNVENLIVAPLSEGANVFGWLLAVNAQGKEQFGTVEASLLSSVAAMLGIHGGNIELYRQQREFLATVVRALTSAIDAKDPYTCGHSDRVARISVRLARELGCDQETLNTIYMAGLLHDIGKIGIDDSVLRKPGRLTESEYEQIKLHPELGYKILADIRQFHDVLPVVLHHHEQWDGRGYPHGLAGEQIPLLARICAVADAYDAMSNDRPYRKGMPPQRVDEIFRAGAGQQWDADVVDVYFRVIDDLREISRNERANLTLDVQQWAQLPASTMGFTPSPAGSAAPAE